MDSNCNKSAEVNGGTPFAEARGSAKCENCIAWERNNKPKNRGWCILLSKQTSKSSGTHCQVFSPNSVLCDSCKEDLTLTSNKTK